MSFQKQLIGLSADFTRATAVTGAFAMVIGIIIGVLGYAMKS